METKPTAIELDARLADALREIANLIDDSWGDIALMREKLERIADIAREALS